MTFRKFIPCRKCRKTSTNPEGYFLKEVNGQQLLVECDHHREWRREKDLKLKYVKAGFSEESFDYKLSTYCGKKSAKNIDRLKKYIACFDDAKTLQQAKRSVLYFYGPNGTQKTTVASSVGRLLLSRGLNVRFILMKQLVDMLWDSQRDDEAKAKVRELTESDVIVIDEAFSRDKIHVWQSGAQIGYVDEFIREHLSLGKGIIFISNSKPDEIEAQGFSHSIQDLVVRELKKDDGLMLFEDNYFDSVSLDQMPDKLF